LKSLILCVPYLQKPAGSELEAIISAINLISLDDIDQVLVFSPNQANFKLKIKAESSQISFINYPVYFKNRSVTKFNTFLKYLFKICKQDYDPIYFFYWIYIRLKYNIPLVYILTPTYSNYFFPIVAGLNYQNIFIKYTAFDLWFCPNKHLLNIYKKCKSIIVTSKTQKKVLRDYDKDLNVQVLDVFLWTENLFLNLQTRSDSKVFQFGILCRISPEKNILDALKLIRYLIDEGYSVDLNIQGILYSQKYLGKLNEALIEMNLEAYVNISTIPLDRSKVYQFYDSIDCFLITSISEGGPTTGLEAMACGKPILSYDIAAMSERLKPFSKYLIANDFNDLCKKAEEILNLSSKELGLLGFNIRSRYLKEYSNENKLIKLKEVLQIQ